RVPGERGERDVGAHDAGDARGDRCAERRELDGVDALGAGGDDGEVDVRVDARVAVAGEVLGGGQRAVLLEPADVRGAEARDVGRIFAVAARVDDGVRRVVVDVDDRRVDHVHADGAGLERG